MKKKTKQPQNKAMREKITPAKFFMAQWKIVKELYEKYRLYTTAIIVIACVTMCASFVDLKFLEYSTNSVSDYFNKSGAISFESIVFTISLFLAAILVIQLLDSLYNRISHIYISKITFEVEKKTISKLSEIPYEYYENNSFYEKINLAAQASSQYYNAVFGVTQMARILVMLVIYGFMLSKINIVYILIILAAIIINVIIAGKVTDLQLDYWRKKVSPESRRSWYFRSVYNNRVNHQNIQTNRSFLYFLKNTDYYLRCERKNYLKLNIFSFSTELATSVLFFITFLITALFVGRGVAEGQFEIGYYSMVIALLVNLYSTVKRFSMFMMNGSMYVRFLDAYYEILNLKPAENIKISGTSDKIEIKGLEYQYPQSENMALQGISTTFSKGEKIAVVGYNGSGKTTLISAVLSLLQNYKGSISYGALSITAIMQDFGQYQMTVKENIEIGCGGRELNEAKIIDILKKVDLYEFISQKPDGIHTKLGQLEEGVELSKGQWQRLAIARLLADKEADVWIMDEPTAYLDPLAEIEMYNFIFSLAGNRLVFFISHRLGFAKNADRIIVINDGKIIEDNTHKNLVQEPDSLYNKMFSAQKEWYA